MYPNLQPWTALDIISLDWISYMAYPAVFMPVILIRGMSDLLACACYWLYAQLQLITGVPA